MATKPGGGRGLTYDELRDITGLGPAKAGADAVCDLQAVGQEDSQYNNAHKLRLVGFSVFRLILTKLA